MAQSVFGRAEPNDLATLDVTKRGREELCACRCDGVRVLDETARLEKSFSPADEQELVYCIASGRGKIRSASVARNSLLANSLGAFSRSSRPSTRSNRGGSSAAPRFASRKFPSTTRIVAASSTVPVYRGRARLARAIDLADQVGDCIGPNYGVVYPAFVTAFLAIGKLWSSAQKCSSSTSSAKSG